MQVERRGPPHPSPLPTEREPSLADPRNSLDGDFAFDCETVLPRPEGEGKGEGERST